MSLDYYGTRLMRGTIQFYHDAALTQAGSFKEQTAAEGRWLIRSNYTCTGWYDSKLYFSNGDLAVEYVIEVEAGDLNEDRCQSDHTEPTDQEKEDEENGKGIGSGSGTDETECWTKICQCIADLKAPINDINTSIGSTNSSLSTINSAITTTNTTLGATNNKLDTLNGTTTVIKDVLTDFRDEFKTNIGYTLPENPSPANLLEDNKPQQNETPFVDNTIYFKDEGDATPPPGKLPKAPEPKHWDGFLPEPALPPEMQLKENEELASDKEGIPDKEGNLDREMVEDKPLQPDLFEKQQELKPDLLELEPIIKTDPIQQTDSMNQSEQFDKAEELNQTLHFGQTNKFTESSGN